ncbi:MAG: ABC transporter ATP-binding protein [Candidatus Dormibacteraeota bacterium]|nr:ABC transporter ATP-binding protein [Candidatus Dormibacteraeota bacterium]
MMRGGGWHGGGGGGPVQRPSGRVPKRRILRDTARLFRPYRLAVVAIGVTVFFTAGVGVANPLLIKVVFDRALFPAAGHPDLHLLLVLVAIMVAIPIISGAVGILQTYLTNRVGQRVMEDLRNRLYEHLQGMSLRFFTGTRTGEIQSRLTNDVGSIQSVVTDTASSLLSNVVILISTLIAMLVLSWQLTALSLFITPLFVLYTYRAGQVRRRITTQAQDSKAEMSAITEETLSVSGILLGKVFGRRREEVGRFRAENHRLANLAIRQEMVGRTLFATIGAFFSSAPALVYLIAGIVLSSSHNSGISPGTIVAFTTLQSRLFFPIGSLLQVSVEIQGSLALFERIFEYLAMPHDIVDRPGAQPLDPASVRGQVRLDHVFFRYDRAAFGPLQTESAVEANGSAADGELVPNEAPRQWALQDVTLGVAPGQLAAIVGPSGAGKTTISYLIPRLYDVTTGRVLIDDVDIRDVQLDSLADVISMVTQETYLFHASVRRNLLYAKPDASDEEMIAAARAAFIHDRIVELDQGYDTIVGERGYRMSGGEKQRLAIARVVLRAPRVLILDEATSALDTTSERLVQAALQPLMSGRTTIAIAHRLSTILAADVIFVIDRGQLIEQGTHDELLRRGGMYATLYEQQFQGGRVEAQCEDGYVLSSGEVVHERAATPA